MARLPKQLLSETEWLVMSALWRLPSGGNVDDIVAVLSRDFGREMNRRELAVFLHRITAKGYATAAAQQDLPTRGRPLHHFRAAVPRRSALQREIERFLDTYVLDDAEGLELTETLARGRLVPPTNRKQGSR